MEPLLGSAGALTHEMTSVSRVLRYESNWQAKAPTTRPVLTDSVTAIGDERLNKVDVVNDKEHVVEHEIRNIFIG